MNAQVMSGDITVGTFEYVGDIDEERRSWKRPEDITKVREGKYTEHGAHLFADISAALASCHIAMSGLEQAEGYANTLLKHAISAYNKASADEQDRRYNGEYADEDELTSFRSKTKYDDLVWAASWLYKALKGADDRYERDIFRFYPFAEQERKPDKHRFNWDDLFIGANLIMLEAKDGEAENYQEQVEEFLVNWVCARPEDIEYTVGGRALNSHAPALGDTVAVAALSIKYAKMQE